MSIFENLVPMVAFWFPVKNSEQVYHVEEDDVVEIEPNAYGYGVSVRKAGQPHCWVPTRPNVAIIENKRPVSITVVRVRKYGYAYNHKHKMIKKACIENGGYVEVYRVSAIQY